MEDKEIGRGPCPVCGNTASIRKSIKGRAYVVCAADEGCGTQIFARSQVSDALLRGRISAAVTEKIESGRVPEIADVSKHAPKAEPAPEPVKIDEPAKPAPGVRRVHSSNGETTVFDVLGNLLRGEK